VNSRAKQFLIAGGIVAVVVAIGILIQLRERNGGEVAQQPAPELTALPPDQPAEPNVAPRPAPVRRTWPRITPPSFPGAMAVVPLPAPVEERCVGGGGRFLILNLPAIRHIAVFDVSAGRVVKYLPTSRERLLLTAGRDALIVVYPDGGVIQRWNLHTFQLEAVSRLPGFRTPAAVAMGSNSVGPLMVVESNIPGETNHRIFNVLHRLLHLPPETRIDREGNRYLLDLATLQPIGEAVQTPGAGWALLHRTLHADSQGTVFTLQTYGMDGLIVRDGADWADRKTRVDMVPAGDGRTLYSRHGFGRIATRADETVGGADNPIGGLNIDHDRPYWFIPPARGPLVYSVRRLYDRQLGNSSLLLGVHRARDSQPLFTFCELPELEGLLHGPAVSALEGRVPLHVFPVPEANLIVTLPTRRDQLVLRRLDVAAELERSGDNRLVVSSAPPPAIVGEQFEYSISAQSRAGGIVAKLDAGPPGMVVSPEGRVTWDVPVNANEMFTVRVTVSDATGQKVEHEFALWPEPVPTKAPDPLPPASIRPKLALKASLVRPARHVMAITPTKAADGAVVKLPGPADAVCYGGGGRFIIFRIPSVKKAAVLDISVGEVVKLIPLPRDETMIAAGMNHLFLADGWGGPIERWNLTTFEREIATKNPFGGWPVVALIGHATDGPVFLAWRLGERGARNNGFLDLGRFAKVDIPYIPRPTAQLPDLWGWTPANYRLSFRISANGRVFTWWPSTSGYHGSGALVFGLESAVAVPSPVQLALLPTSNATVLNLGGELTSELVETRRLKPSPNHSHFWERPPIPAAHGPLYLEVNVPPNSGGGRPKGVPPPISDPRFPADWLTLRLVGHDSVIAIVPELAGLKISNEPRDQSQLPVYDRVFLVPGAKLLALLSRECDQVHMHRLDTDALLAKSKLDYLFVDGWPSGAERGKRFIYSPTVKSSRGGVKLRLESGPTGMMVDGQRLIWDVPADFDAADVTVIVTVSDAAGRETPHAFTVAVGSAP